MIQGLDAPFLWPSNRTFGRSGMKSMQRVCLNCQRPFESSKAAEYCSGRCRAEASRKRKAQGRSERDRKVRGLLEEALEVLGVGEESV